MRLKSSVSVISNREIAVQFLMTTSEIIRMLYQRIELGFDRLAPVIMLIMLSNVLEALGLLTTSCSV